MQYEKRMQRFMPARRSAISRLDGHRVAVIGVGNIGRILLERLTLSGSPDVSITVCDTDVARAEMASRRFGPRTCLLTDEAIYTSDIFLLTAPPKATLDILKTLSPNLHQGQIVVSFAAAISMSRLEAVIPPGVAVARVMPNAPSKVGKGMNPVAYGSNVSAEARRMIESILQMLGATIEVKDEQMNWCAGLTGAAMRSLLPALEGMTQAGIEAGFADTESRRMAAQVMFGTAALVLERDSYFDEIKSLTPMETVDETAMQKLFADAARAAKEKMDGLQRKLEEGSP